MRLSAYVDSVLHRLLLRKLSWSDSDHRLLKLFQSYLVEQKQVVKVDGCISGVRHQEFIKVVVLVHFFILFRPTLVGEELYTQMGFFVRSILADQYNRRVLWVVSLESPSSVEYGIETIFSIFVFYRELSRFKNLRILDVIQLFLFTFSVFWPNFCQFR